MKKLLAILLMVGIITTFSACGGATPDVADDNNERNVASEPFTGTIKVSAASLDELNDKIADFAYVESAIFIKIENYQNPPELNSGIDSYEKYKRNTDKIEKFYGKVLEETHGICMRLYVYSLEYARYIMDSDKSFGEKYDDFEELYDTVYEDAGDDIYDAIYDGILDEMYDAFYDGILSDSYDEVAYGEWYEANTDAYDIWSDTKSDVYDEWSDMKSDIYDFWVDMREEMWDKDQERAEKKYNDFLEDTKKIAE